jgi:hypothetical protein
MPKPKLQGLAQGGMVEGQDSWTDQPTVKQATMKSPAKLKHPRMVPISGASVRLRDEEDHLEQSEMPGSPSAQPPKADDEMRPDRKGPSVPALKMKKMAEGGHVSMEIGEEPEMDELEHPAGLEEDDDQMKPSDSEIMANHFAHGGEVEDDLLELGPTTIARDDKGYGAIIHKASGGMIQPEPEADDEHHDSIVAAIMAKRHKMADGGMVDIDSNAEEQPNSYYARNEDAALKENYDSDMDDVSQPMDSNEHSDDIDSDSHDMVSQIRRKMSVKRAFR